MAFTRFVRPDVARRAEYVRVADLADGLLEHLNQENAQRLIEEANRPGSSSALVQATVEPFATATGFRSEIRGLFSDQENRSLRPDYYMPVGDSGILLEVERGKTTINNMDILDLWKCHICSHADHLFLMVPRELRQNATMSPRHEFDAVVRRMSSFFRESTYTNVRSLHVFGY